MIINKHSRAGKGQFAFCQHKKSCIVPQCPPLSTDILVYVPLGLVYPAHTNTVPTQRFRLLPITETVSQNDLKWRSVNVITKAAV